MAPDGATTGAGFYGFNQPVIIVIHAGDCTGGTALCQRLQRAAERLRDNVERFLAQLDADTAARLRRQIVNAREVRQLQLEARPTPEHASSAERPTPIFGFEHRQRWGTGRGNRKAPRAPRRFAEAV